LLAAQTMAVRPFKPRSIKHSLAPHRAALQEGNESLV
jgi:hypothetical protein